MRVRIILRDRFMIQNLGQYLLMIRKQKAHLMFTVQQVNKLIMIGGNYSICTENLSQTQKTFKVDYKVKREKDLTQLIEEAKMTKERMLPLRNILLESLDLIKVLVDHHALDYKSMSGLY